MSRITMLVAFGAGYVLGARAGRERYREIRQKAEDFWHSDAVQQQRDHAQQVAKAQASKAQEAARDRLPAALGGRQSPTNGGAAPGTGADTSAGPAASEPDGGGSAALAGTTASSGTGPGGSEALGAPSSRTGE